MSFKEYTLILIVFLLIFINSSLSFPDSEANQQNITQCYSVYYCCEKTEELDCNTYCGPIEECVKTGGSGQSVLNVSMCRRGLRLVNGFCKRVL